MEEEVRGRRAGAPRRRQAAVGADAGPMIAEKLEPHKEP